MPGVCIHFNVACVMQAMMATRADTYINELRNTKVQQLETTSESSTTWRHRTEFSKKVSEQIWLSHFWSVFYKRTEANAKQTVRSNSPQTIC